MTYVGALAVGLVVHRAAQARTGPREAAYLAAAAAGGLVMPGSLLLSGPAFLALRWWTGKRPGSGGEEAGILGRVLLIGLSAGLPLAAALELAAGEVDSATAGEVRRVLRRASRIGLAAALAASEGRFAPLFVRLARSQVTGSSAYGAVSAFVDEERSKRRALAKESVQRLPVKLTIPLALLILPGFVLLTIGPVVVGTVERLLGSLLP